jgi:hypothetical protein
VRWTHWQLSKTAWKILLDQISKYIERSPMTKYCIFDKFRSKNIYTGWLGGTQLCERKKMKIKSTAVLKKVAFLKFIFQPLGDVKVRV